MKTLNGCSSKLYLLQFLRSGPQILTQTSKLDSKKYCSFRFLEFLAFLAIFTFFGAQNPVFSRLREKKSKIKKFTTRSFFFNSRNTSCVQISSSYLEKPRRR